MALEVEMDCASLILPSGHVLLFDEQDRSIVDQYLWYAIPFGRIRYAKGRLKSKERKSNYGFDAYLHRLLLNPPKGLVVDHRNHNGLDNRRANLRLCTRQENTANQAKRSREASSRFKGVNCRTPGRWIAQIAVKQQRKYLGTFATEEDAARAYDRAAREHFGEFAYLNFKEEVK